MYGHYFRNLDEKKRVVLPSKFKKELGSEFFATLGPDHVLVLRDKKSFMVWKNKLTSVNMLNADARTFARALLGNTIEVELDKQNRIKLPDHFITLTTLTKEVVFVGIGNGIELWAKSDFDKFQKQFEGKESLDKLAKKLLEDGVEL